MTASSPAVVRLATHGSGVAPAPAQGPTTTPSLRTTIVAALWPGGITLASTANVMTIGAAGVASGVTSIAIRCPR